MSIKSLLQQLDSITESENKVVEETEISEDENFSSKKVSTGTVYQRKYDPDSGETTGTKRTDEPSVKRGRGRPKKNADDSGSEPKYANAAALQSFMVGNLPKSSGKKGTVIKGKAQSHAVNKDDATESVNENRTFKDWMKQVETQRLAEAALDPSQVAVAAVKSPGSSSQKPQTTTTQPAQTSTQPQMGAAIVDFKDPNDPLKAALAQAVQNKEVSVLGEKEVDEAAPKGWEGTVKALKKHSDEVDNPWALAHWMKNKGYKSHKKESSESVMESYTLRDVLDRYPHEHKLCQEGWGLDENLYEALSDFYFREGRIPHKVWHGPLEELRKCVEECYMQDTQELEEGILGTVGGALAGAALGGPVGAAIGSTAGQELTKGGSSLIESNMSEVDSLLSGIFAGDVDVYNLLSSPSNPIESYVAKMINKKIDSIAATSPELDFEAVMQRALEELESEVNEGLAGATLGGIAGGVLTKTPQGAITGANIGSELQDQLAEEKDEDIMNEKYTGHKKLTKSLAAKGAKDPAALASWIGREKYGKEKFQKAAAAGKKLGEEGVNEGSDLQMESWDKQLQDLLNEGITVTSTVGTENASDSVSVYATDSDAAALQEILQKSGLLKNAGSMQSGAEAQDQTSTTTVVEPASADEVMSTLQGDEEESGDSALDFLKKMLGARQEHSSVEVESQETEKEPTEEGYDPSWDPESKYHRVPGWGDSDDEDEEYEKERQRELDDEDEVEEGNAFGAAVAKAKADGIQPGEKVEVGGKEYPVKEESDHTCNECGLNESDCECDHESKEEEDALNEWANSPNDSDETFLADIAYMTKLVSGGLNNIKRDQTVLPSTQVVTKSSDEQSFADLLKKLGNIN